MTRQIRISADDADPVLRILARLNNPDPMLRQIAAIMTATSQQSFEEQRLGEFVWRRRYPFQSEPFVNIAGLVADLAKGGSVKGRRFVRRPALIDTNALRLTVNSRIAGKNKVETGTPLPYAALHQFGGTSTQMVTDHVKKGLAKFLRSARGKQYRGKLGFLFNTEALETEVNQRPFIGITDEAEKQIVKVVEDHLADG